MRGRILDYNGSDFRGLIAGQDARRYDFVRIDWKGAGEPALGMDVEFRPDAAMARDILLAAPGVAQPPRPAPPPYSPPNQTQPGQPYQPAPAQPFTRGDQPYGQPGQNYGQPSRMDFPDAVRICIEKYVTFSGRARRAEFWWFVLFVILVRTVAVILDQAVSYGPRGAGPFSALSGLGLLLPWLAVMTRRMHDTDRSGFWVLGFYVATFIVAGGFFAAIFILLAAPQPSGAASLAIYLCGLAWLGIGITWIVILCLKGTHGSNRYGPDPLYPQVDVDVF